MEADLSRAVVGTRPEVVLASAVEALQAEFEIGLEE